MKIILILLLQYGIALFLLCRLRTLKKCSNENCKDLVGCNYTIIKLYEKIIYTLFLSANILIMILV
jgi:hypothetical protein